MNYNSYLKMFQLLKAQGITKEEAFDCLEFESDQDPSEIELKAAFNDVFGGDEDEKATPT
jgi:hypothetical protein